MDKRKLWLAVTKALDSAMCKSVANNEFERLSKVGLRRSNKLDYGRSFRYTRSPSVRLTEWAFMPELRRCMGSHFFYSGLVSTVSNQPWLYELIRQMIELRR